MFDSYRAEKQGYGGTDIVDTCDRVEWNVWVVIMEGQYIKLLGI